MDETVGDIMLRWMSEVGSGTITDLRNRIDWISRSVDLIVRPGVSGRWLRDVSSLGHCEVDWNSGQWSVAPSALVRLPGSDGLAVISGARRPRTMRPLNEFWGGLAPARREPPAGEIPLPITYYVTFRAEAELTESAAEAGVALGGVASLRIVTTLTKTRPRVATGPPAYKSELMRFEASSAAKWEAVSASDINPPDGLYSEQVHGRPRFMTRRDGEWFECNLSSGTFAELAREGKSALRWRPDPGRTGADVGTVFVDWGAPLPALHSRALVLCTGLPPKFGNIASTAIYENVPRGVAARICTSLDQPFVVD